ncbi:MAG: flagellar hook-associated protein FlgL [Desulfovibrionaceae bacterium]|nr:flagellar hook-associated protein FlgL [Desulfovibrionaceae bacterium]
MRVSQRNLFSHMVGDMNNSLSRLMDLNIQSSSHKKINKPSDDAVGASRVLSYRNSIGAIDQYQSNIGEAKGWLNLADNTLVQVNTVLTRIKELAEQAANGTYDGTNRKQISYEVRQLFEQLINLSNTEYEGKHIFAGQKTEQSAFSMGLSLTSSDPNVTNFRVEGSSDSTVLVQFLDSGAVGGATDLDYRYSSDGGDTWTDATLAAGQNVLDLNGVRLTLANGTAVSAVDPDSNAVQDNGTWLWVRPAAIYQGDDEDAIDVTLMGATQDVSYSASGAFPEDTIIRIDNASDTSLAGRIEYSYSRDGGQSWVTGNSVSNAATPGEATLVVPGGFLQLTSNGSNIVHAGDQFLVHPRRADVNFEISPNEFITVNSVGKDVFGGVYTAPGQSNASAMFDGGPKNMFETVGKLLAYLETDNQAGVSQALEDLRVASSHVLTHAASVGGRENRLTVAANMHTNNKLSEEERMSAIEDVDVAELMTQLAQQELIYQSVLKSSSMVMRMNLTNYI